MNSGDATWLATTKLMLWRALDSQGVDARALFEQAGLDPDAVQDPDARYPAGPASRLWALAVEATGDPALGLKLARHWHPSNLHALGFAWMASSSLRDAFARLARYGKVVLHGDVLEIRDTAEGFWVGAANVPTTPAGAETIYDAYLAVLLTMCRALCGPDLTPLRVTLQRSTPVASGEYFALFRAPVEFDSTHNALILPQEALDARLPTANTEIARASDAIAAQYLSQFERSQISMRVQAILVERLPSGIFNAALIAAELNLSPRTLQRRLSAEGTSFNRLVNRTRRELAKQYIRETTRPVGEVAYSLGFSEVSNFSRAFRRWTGVSPSEYRVGAAQVQRSQRLSRYSTQT